MDGTARQFLVYDVIARGEFPAVPAEPAIVVRIAEEYAASFAVTINLQWANDSARALLRSSNRRHLQGMTAWMRRR